MTFRVVLAIVLLLSLDLVSSDDPASFSSSIPLSDHHQKQTMVFKLNEISRVGNGQIASKNKIYLKGTDIYFQVLYNMETYNNFSWLSVRIIGASDGSNFIFRGCGHIVMVNNKNRDNDTEALPWAAYIYDWGTISDRESFPFNLLGKNTILDKNNGWIDPKDDSVTIEWSFDQYTLTL